MLLMCVCILCALVEVGLVALYIYIWLYNIKRLVYIVFALPCPSDNATLNANCLTIFELVCLSLLVSKQIMLIDFISILN